MTGVIVFIAKEDEASNRNRFAVDGVKRTTPPMNLVRSRSLTRMRVAWSIPSLYRGETLL
jgi:hypothetical protein